MSTLDELKEKIRPHIEILQEGEVHVLIAVARKKYNQNIPSATDYRKTGIWREELTIKNWEQKVQKVYALVNQYKHEIAQPEDYNYYITHNPRSLHKALKVFKHWIAEYDDDHNIDRLYHMNAEWFSSLQKPEGRSRKLSFVIDVDTTDNKVVETIASITGCLILQRIF